MWRFGFSLRGKALLVLLGLALSLPTIAATPDPKQTVQEATDILLAKLIEVKPLYKSDPKTFFTEIDGALGPFIDFDGFSRGVMAKYYRRASEDQQKEFINTFRTGLIETYAKALVEFDNEKVVVLDAVLEPDRPDRASIGLEIHSENNKIYPVEYSLILVDDRWLLRNVVIEGINIGLQFRSQFASYMQKYRNDIDEVIANWSVDV
jgi:phospholipid transport system substrate-binding protein